jgi:hypothetical protein
MTPRLIAALLLLATCAACSDVEPVPEGDPKLSLSEGKLGYELKNDVMIDDANEVRFLRSALLSYAPPTDKAVPAKVETLDLALRCGFPKPKPNEKLVLVHAGAARTPSPLYLFTKAQVTERAQALLEAQKAKAPEPSMAAYAEADNVPVVEVVVGAGAVSLVLASNESVLWNLQLSPKAKLLGVAIVSEKNAAIANLPANVPVSAMTRLQAETCRVAPQRMPARHWQLSRSQNEADKETVRNLYQRGLRFGEWYRGVFDRDPEKDAVGAPVLGNVLVGDLPERFPAASLAGSTVKISKSDYFIVGPRKDYEAGLADLVKAQAKALAEGKLTALTP